MWRPGKSQSLMAQDLIEKNYTFECDNYTPQSKQKLTSQHDRKLRNVKTF